MGIPPTRAGRGPSLRRRRYTGRMPKPTLAGKLVVAISSRALFDLTESHRIYTEDGVDAYHRYQVEHEDEILAPGPAFVLVKKLLRLNRPDKQYVEVILLSRNSADTGLRVFNCDQALRARHHARRVHQGRADVALRPGVRRAPLPVGGPGRRPARARRRLRGGDDLPERGRRPTRRTSCGSPSTATRCSSPTRPSACTRRTGSPRSRKAKPTPRCEPLTGGPFKEFLAALHRIQADFPEDAEPDPHRARHRAQRAGARARDPHAARLEHPDRRGAVPRRPRQGRVPARLSRRHLLRRPAHARRIGREARGRAGTCRTAWRTST